MTTAPVTGSPGGQVPASRRRMGLRLLFAGVVVAQLLAVYWPRIDVQGPVTWSDKVVHVLLFLVPTVVGLRAGLHRDVVVGALAAHAPVSELVQHYVLPHRTGDVWDAVADLGGVVLGVTLVMVGEARRRW